MLLCINGHTQCQDQQTVTLVTVIFQCLNCNTASFACYWSLLYSLYFVFASSTVHQWFCSLHHYMSVTITCVIWSCSNYCLHVIVITCRDICYGVDMQAVYSRKRLKLIVMMIYYQVTEHQPSTYINMKV